MTDSPQHVAQGDAVLHLTCPRCEEPVLVAGVLGARLTIDSADMPTIRARLATRAVVHLCDQLTLVDLFHVDGEPANPAPELDR